MLERTWKTIEGETQDVAAVLTELSKGPAREIHIGSDSQQNGKWTELVTVIAVLEPGKGGRASYTRERLPRIKSLRERLMREVWSSVTAAIQVNGIIPEFWNMTVHIDANPNLRFKSSAYIKELTAMVVSQGFKAVLKPEAWCASHTADHVVKHKVMGL